MKGNLSHFGEILKELRKSKGKSQIEVAEEIEELFPGEIRISQTTLSTLEQSEKAPRQEVLEILADYYNVPITYFFDSIRADERSRVERAKEYLEVLKRANFDSRRIFAHSTAYRRDNDEIEQSLDRMIDQLDDGEFYLDSDAW